jgi:hypothetical protein
MKLHIALNSYKDIIRILQHEAYATIWFENGSAEKREFYYAKGYLSAPSRCIFVTNNMIKIRIFTFGDDFSREILL